MTSGPLRQWMEKAHLVVGFYAYFPGQAGTAMSRRARELEAEYPAAIAELEHLLDAARPDPTAASLDTMRPLLAAILGAGMLSYYGYVHDKSLSDALEGIDRALAQRGRT